MTIAFDYDSQAELFDYDTPAELYSNKGRRLRRQPLEYRQFARAADAIRFAIEEMSPQLLQSAYLEVDEERFDSQAIRRLYESTDYFARPFRLCGVDRVLAAGSYEVHTEEELIEGLSFPVYRRVSTVIFVPGEIASSLEMVAIDPLDLAAAQDRDAVPQDTQEQPCPS